MSNIKKIFIDEEINILKDNNAIEALKLQNDSSFLSEGKGITKVTYERWEKAQKCEKKHWLVRGINNADDRNYFHMKCFDGYKSLKNKSFNNAIELGCGPFTNIRLIGGVTNIKHCSLLDPLINEYINHPYASYNKSFLRTEKNRYFEQLYRKLYFKFFKSFIRPLYKEIPIKYLIKTSIEQFETEEKFDLLIMINVIEHCFDIRKIFDKILKITSESAFFVFTDKLYEHEEIALKVYNEYDAAHPLKVDKKLINEYLENNFTTVFSLQNSNYAEFDGIKAEWKDLYFIGQKK